MLHIHSLISYAAVGGPHHFVVLQGHPGPGLSSLFYNSIHNGPGTLLYSIYSHLYLNCPTGPIDGALQAESYIPGISQEEPFIVWSLFKE